MNDYKADLHLDPSHPWELEAAKREYANDERRAIAKRDIFRHLEGVVQGYGDMKPYETDRFVQAVERLRAAAEDLRHDLGEGKDA